MSNVSIPHDLVCNVVSRLPAKSLLRFKCVSKSWYLMIDDPEFVKTHAKRSELNESNMKLIAHGFSNGVQKLYAVDFNFSESFEAKNMEEINYSSIMKNGSNGLTLGGSCNGLVCVVYSKRDAIIVLWNPTTRKQLELPIYSEQDRSLKINDNCVHGFGYDEVTDDYKVVRFGYMNHKNSAFCVYSLKSNEWKRLEGFAYRNDLMWQFDGVFANGALHWLLNDRSILAFNLATEGFELLPPPETSIKSALLCVAVVGGNRHLIFLSFDGCPREMWAMKNYGTKDCWTKLTLDSSTLMYIACVDMVIIYDLENQAFKELKFPVSAVDVKSCFYFESLVRLDAGGRSDGIVGDSRKQIGITGDSRQKNKID